MEETSAQMAKFYLPPAPVGFRLNPWPADDARVYLDGGGSWETVRAWREENGLNSRN